MIYKPSNVDKIFVCFFFARIVKERKAGGKKCNTHGHEGNLTRLKIGADIYDDRPYVRRKFITQIEEKKTAMA